MRIADGDADLDACAWLSYRFIRDSDLRSSRDDMKRHAAEPRNLLLVANLPGGRIVGYGRVTWVGTVDKAPANVAPPGYYLGGMAVDTAYRRRGVGRRLTAERLRRLAGCTDEAWYIVNKANDASIDLHLAHGFHEASRDFVFPGVVLDGPGTVLYHLPLGPLSSQCPGCPDL